MIEDPERKVIELMSRKTSVGDGGDGGGGMLERVKRLEEDVKEARADLKAVREKLAKIEGEVSRLPGYPGIAMIVGLIVALSTAAQIGAKYLP